jgi:hypothetical protein
MFDRKISSYMVAGGHVAGHNRAKRDKRPVADGYFIGNRRIWSNPNIIANSRIASEHCVGNNETSLSNFYIVGNMHKVINLGILSYFCGFMEYSTANNSICLYLDPVVNDNAAGVSDAHDTAVNSTKIESL